MPQKISIADALGVVTICLVAILVLVGLLCILYSLYLRNRIRRQRFYKLNYFTGPWIIRIVFVVFVIWWGFGEIARLNFLRGEGRLLNALNLKWQEIICKYYVVSNLGFAEPCIYLTLVFLLRASLQKTERGALSHKWNRRTAGYVLLYCLPVFVLQLIVLLIAPEFNEGGPYMNSVPNYFTKTAHVSDNAAALCTYPLLSTVVLGLFVIVLTTYLLWLGGRVLKLVINKGLQKRLYALVLSFSGFFPLRVLLLGLSVISSPEKNLFEALSFLAFLSLLGCAGMGFCVLVFFPVSDSLALSKLEDGEDRRRSSDEYIDASSLITNQALVEGFTESSPARDSVSVAEATRGSISFRSMAKDETSGTFVELSLFSSSQQSSPPGSPQLRWPKRPAVQAHDP
ncbi:hypothetical protein LguiB_006654 [Lonicera macranthoides]